MTPTIDAPAASSPAIVNTTVFTPDSAADRAEFFKTGSMPEPKAVSTPAKETPEKGAPVRDAASESEPENKHQEPKRSNADTRLNELLDDLREAGLTPKALKSFKQEYKRADAAEQPKPEQPKVETKGPVKPKAEDFEGKPWSEYEAARDKYFEDLTDFKAEQAVEKDRQRQRDDATTSELKTKLEDAKARYGAEAETTIRDTSTAIFNDAGIQGVVKALVNDSPVLVDLLYVIGSKPEDLADFIETAKSNPGAAIRKLVLVEKLVMEELAKGGKPEGETVRGEDGKFKATAPEKKTTAAPPPPKEVNGTQVPPPEEYETAMQAALKTGDSRKVIDLENQREIRRRKGR